MFESIFVENSGGSRSSWSLVASFLTQSLLVGVAVLLPLLATNTLPAQQWVQLLLEPPPPPAAAPAPRAPERPRAAPSKPERADDSVFSVPAAIPEKAVLLTDVDDPQTPGPESYPAIGVVGVPPGVPGGIAALGQRQIVVKPPPAPAPSRPQGATPHIVEVGGKVQAAKLVRKVEPVYPSLARHARISGTVRLEAIIAADGRIRELKVISGHPLLVQSALDAVRQWRYQPTLLNNAAMEVLTHIDVNYTLR